MSPCCLVDDHPKNDMSIPQTVRSSLIMTQAFFPQTEIPTV